MNNAWSVAFRLPCRGLNSSWTPLAKDISAWRMPISTAIAREAQFTGRRAFGSTQWTLAAKKRTPSSKQPPKPLKPLKPLQPSNAQKVPIPPSLISKKTVPNPQPAKPTPKAQVQLSEAQVASIVGHDLTFGQGMDLLQEIQFRRVTGSLLDKGLDFPDRPEFTRDQAFSALEWLREEYPVDEEAAAIEYADELAQEERRVLEERAKKLKLYKTEEADSNDEEQVAEEVYVDESYNKTPVRPDQTRDITSGSALAARKEYVEASRKKAKIEAQKAAEEMEARGEKPPEPYKGHDIVVSKNKQLDTYRKEKFEHWNRLKQEAELDTNEMTRERPAIARLWAPITFGLAVVGLLWVYAERYEPPKSSMRLFPEISPATATIAAIAAINFVLLVAWRYPYAWKYMNKYFMLSPGIPRAPNVVLSLFSHQAMSHFFWNMGFLYLVGSPVHEEVGRGTFISMYLSTGIIGYLCSLTVNVLSRDYLSATIGASAAVFGLLGVYFTISEKRTITLPSFLGGKYEFSGWIALIPVAVVEFVRWRMERGVISGGTDFMSHFGGVVCGAVMGYIVRKRLEKQRTEYGDIAVQTPAENMSPLSTTKSVASS